MAGAWARVGVLAAIGLLVSACNHEVRPVDRPGGGGTGGGDGTSGPATGGAGAGDAASNQACLDGTDACIDSCGQSPVVRPHADLAYCDATTGAFSCADPLVKLSSCAPNSCVRATPTCCDEAHSILADPPCGADGLQQACPAGTHLFTEQAGCMTPGVDVTDCAALQGQACASRGDKCMSRTSSTVTSCSCQTFTTSSDIIWDCSTKTAQ